MNRHVLKPCTYCKGHGPDPGWIWTDNNGPIVSCPICNPDGDKDLIWERAEAQRDDQRRKAEGRTE